MVETTLPYTSIGVWYLIVMWIICIDYDSTYKLMGQFYPLYLFII